MPRKLISGEFTTTLWPNDPVRHEVEVRKAGSNLVATIALKDWRDWFNAYGHIDAARKIWEGSVAKRERAIQSGTPGTDHRG